MMPSARPLKPTRRDSFMQRTAQPDSLLGEEINLFESDSFSPEAFVQSKCQAMSEKNIRRLCGELQNHKKASAMEMQRSVFANYKEFIRTAREISDLEGELRSMGNLLTSQCNLIHSLVEAPPVLDPRDATQEIQDYTEDEDADYQEYEIRLRTLPDALDVALAERKVDSALRLLQQGEELVKSGTVNPRGETFLAEALAKRRLELTEQLAEVAMQPSVSGSELRAAISALNRLGDGARAHTLLLSSHGQRLRIQIRPMRPSGSSYTGAYTAAVSQLVFSAISQAAKDSATVFGNQASYSSELVLWAHSETEWCANLLTQYVLANAAESGTLRSAAECVQIAMGHCQLLEEQGLSLTPVLSRLVRPCVERALEGNLERILDSVKAMAAADDWYLQPSITAAQGRFGRSSSGPPSNVRLTSSAQRLYSMVQEFLEDVGPIITLNLGDATLDGLLDLFEQYMGILLRALHQEESLWDADDAAYNVQTVVDERQQLALIGNAVFLAEELPRVAMRLTTTAEKPSSFPKSDSFRSTRSLRAPSSVASGSETALRLQLQPWKKILQKKVENLRFKFCSQKATDLLYPDEEGQEPVLPSLYFNMDQVESDPNEWRQNPMPSQPMQHFFWTAQTISRVGFEVLAGRDRMVLQLLTQFAIALLTLVCHAEMWEDSRFFVGPVGLQQFLLDMHFLKEVSTRGHYASRQLQLIADTSMERAKDAFNVGEASLDDELFREWALKAVTQLQIGGDHGIGEGSGLPSPRSGTGPLHDSDDGR